MAATIKQVAERAGVSTATVSYVLNGTGTVTEATRQRVLAIVAELAYQPSHAARSMRGRSYTLGLALPAQPGRLANPATAEVLDGLAGAAARRGYSLLLAPPDAAKSEAEHCLNLVRTGRVDGIVLMEPHVDDERAQALHSAGQPHICLGQVPGNDASLSVSINGKAGAALATRHLLGLGHRRVGLIQLPSHLAESEPRYLGYIEALEAAKLEGNPQLVVEAGQQEDDGYLAMQELLSLPEPPTAVLACNDELAFGALHALYDAGLAVGSDLSLVGFDDVPLAAHTHPPLTTLHQPRRTLGEQLALLLVDAIEHRPIAHQHISYNPRLVVRRSTGPPLV